MTFLQRHIASTFVMMVSILLIFSVAGCGGDTATTETSSTTEASTSSNTETTSEGTASTESQDVDSQESTDIKFMSAPPGGTWYVEAEAIGKVFQDTIPGFSVTVSSGGAASNPIGVADNQADLGLSFGNTLKNAYEGRNQYDEALSNLRMQSGLFRAYVMWIVPQSSDIDVVEDLTGKEVAAGPKGLVSEFIAAEMFDVYGIEDISIRNMGFQDCVEALKDGQVDAVTLTPDMPYYVYLNAAKTLPIRVVKFDEDRLDEFVARNPGFAKTSIPKEELVRYYGEGSAQEDFLTAVTPQVLLTNSSVSEEAVYQMTKALAEGMETIGETISTLKDYDLQDMYVDVGVPYHPGALRYYEEMGWVE